ncbi:6221_t:CDS:2 [Ambispora gerdemannii]|uniref:Postreplication repair E3 ubiquitin-protein ligase RAD18 n=1 Tax=Ambispora gerdemannii TaxID=144530 RepID=A0A9N8YNS7_9GLOM|nr:6221_t:CDS:2 [Ambispora gerdemannii]
MSFLLKEDTQPMTDPSDWPPHPEYRQLDLLFRCSVCFEFFQTPMMAKCGHVFCANCINACIIRDPGCPLCRTTCSLDDLRKDIVLQDIVNQYIMIRPELLKIVTEYSMLKNANKSEMVHPVELGKSITIAEASNSPLSPPTSLTVSTSLPPSISSESSPEVEYLFTVFRDVAPPLENKAVLSTSTHHQTHHQTPQEGLSTIGSKAEMIKRHAEYVNLYNANVDATNPKSHRELLSDMRIWETAQRNNKKRNTNSSVQHHLNKYQDQFNELISKARQNLGQIQSLSSSVSTTYSSRNDYSQSSSLSALGSRQFSNQPQIGTSLRERIYNLSKIINGQKQSVVASSSLSPQEQSFLSLSASSSSPPRSTNNMKSQPGSRVSTPQYHGNVAASPRGPNNRMASSASSSSPIK